MLSVVLRSWTGAHACDLQAALRMSNDDFAAHLGLSARTVATWHARPDLIPRTEAQQILDTAVERATPAQRERFDLLTAERDVYCVYYRCEYLTGEAENRDVIENLAVAWAPITDLTRFVPRPSLYPPILHTLQGAA